ncbi:MAG: apolipoprotein N-acyltransferase [Planctomycetia bacterium]|nr:apolipoprotein N-acyltransferase [Planctomycetia bacterium]
MNTDSLTTTANCLKQKGEKSRLCASTWGCSLFGAALMFLSLPPVDLWWLGWIAPVPWLLLVRREQFDAHQSWMPLWIGGFTFWLCSLHWLRLPHPATAIGWILLSGFLALYLPLFVLISRRMVHYWNIPFCIGTPVAWVGLEFARGWLFGGFTMAAISHTQWRWTTFIQAADIVGASGLCGVLVCFAAAVAATVPLDAHPWRPTQCVGALLILGLTLFYGTWRLSEMPNVDARQIEILLVQGSIDTELKQDPDAAEEVVRHYDDLTIKALQNGPHPSLIVWPETMWRWGLLEIDKDEILDETIVTEVLGPIPSESALRESQPDFRQRLCRETLQQQRLDGLAAFARRYSTNWLVGLDRQRVTKSVHTGQQNFNSALFLDQTGKPLGCYDKMYPVLFGEYVPLANIFPWLYRLTPLPVGLTAGTTPLAVTIDGTLVAVNICYETTLPRSVRQTVLKISQENRRPDLLVNLSNDGWFWGSSELDLHLVSALFRSVEVRTPFVIAANTGISAWIDGSGRLRERGPKRNTAVLRARVVADGRWSLFLFWGEWPSGICFCVVFCVILERIMVRFGEARALKTGFKMVFHSR